MLSPRLTNCPECANIPSLLKKIDCKLAELGNSLYNNVSYMLNNPIPAGDILQLIGYRRILQYKYINPNYVHAYSVNMIASRVIRLTVGCVSKCNTPEPCLEVPCNIVIVPNPTTTTTSSSTTTTTTTIPLVLISAITFATCGNCPPPESCAAFESVLFLEQTCIDMITIGCHVYIDSGLNNAPEGYYERWDGILGFLYIDNNGLVANIDVCPQEIKII
jgi:hypothetical protein